MRPTPEPGTFFYVRGHTLLDEAIRIGTKSDASHAGLVVDAERTMEMEARGAMYGSLAARLADPGVVFAYGQPLVATERVAVAYWASWLVEHQVKYSFEDIAALTGYELFGLDLPIVDRFIGRQHSMICSQSVDWCNYQAGFHLFDDKRPFQKVTPANLEWLSTVHGWDHYEGEK